MADKRYNELMIGNPGRLEYYPPEVRRANDRGWLTARNHEEDIPKLTELGSHQKWLASADQKQLSTSMRSTWHEHRKQKRWLLKNHPEAALQDEVLGEILNLEISPRQHTRMAEWQFTQFAVGEMTDISNQQQKITGAPLLAMAAGSAGDTLRIVRPSTNFWSLGEGEGEPVRLLEHAAHQETLWTKDIGTIRCIQAVVSTKRFDPVRWLVVQRASSTSVFRPEYRKVPVVSETFSGTGPQAPSHIAPNLLFKISTTQTGVNPHCDASFNPGIRSAPAQLAIMDEGGNWTIWEISGTRKKVTKHPKAQLRKCGNIHKGVRDRPSSRAAAKPQWHAIFWVGRAPTHDAEDEFDEGEMAADEAASSFPTLKRSSILLLCNRKLLRLLDLETNQFLPDFHFMSTESKDLILDVQVDKEDSRYFYVVTTSRLFILAVLTTVDAVDGLLTKKVLILQSFPHLRSKLDRNLKVTIADGATSSTGRTVHVILYSQYSSWYDVFYIRYSRQFPEQIVCHHGSLLSRDIASKAVNGGLQTLCVTPTPILLRQSDGGFDAHRVYFGGEERYFQFFSFGADLDLSYCLGSSSTVIWRKGVLTTRRVAETELISGARPKSRPHIAKLEKYSRQKVEREKAVRYLATRFIVADSVAEFRYRDDIITASVKAATTSNQPTKLLSRMVAPVHEQFHDMLRKLWPKNDRSKEVAIFGAAPFDPVFVAFQEALETKSLPLKTIFDLVEHFRVPENYRETSQDWQTEIEELGRADPVIQISRLDKPYRSINDGSSLEELFSGLVGLTLDEDPRELLFNSSSGSAFLVGQLACELFLSRYGMTYLSPEARQLPGRASMDIRSSSALMPEDMLIDSQESTRSTIRSSSVAFESQASSRASTPASTAHSVTTRASATDETGIGGFDLIRALTGSATMPLQRRSKLPSPWTVGEDSPRTVFTVDNNIEVTDGMRRRAKQEAREARKRKRAETFLQLQQENLLSSTQPSFHANFYTQASQPLNDYSSQPRVVPSAAAIAMSQPVAGAFGGRSDFERPKKKPKRKGGF